MEELQRSLVFLLATVAAVSSTNSQFYPRKETFQHPTLGETYCFKFCNSGYKNGESYCWEKCRVFMAYYEGEKRGREEGREAGREEGREEGRKEGREEGRKEGREEGREAVYTAEKSLPPTPSPLTHDSSYIKVHWFYIVAAVGSISLVTNVVQALELYRRSKSVSRQPSVVEVQEMGSQLNKQAPPSDQEALLSVVVDTEHVAVDDAVDTEPVVDDAVDTEPVVDDAVDMEPAVAPEVQQVPETPMKSPTLQQPANGEEMPSGKPVTKEDDTTPPDSMNLLTVTGKPHVTEKPD